MRVLLLVLILASTACSVKFQSCLPRCEETQPAEPPQEEKSE